MCVTGHTSFTINVPLTVSHLLVISDVFACISYQYCQFMGYTLSCIYEETILFEIIWFHVLLSFSVRDLVRFGIGTVHVPSRVPSPGFRRHVRRLNTYWIGSPV